MAELKSYSHRRSSSQGTSRRHLFGLRSLENCIGNRWLGEAFDERIVADVTAGWTRVTSDDNTNLEEFLNGKDPLEG